MKMTAIQRAVWRNSGSKKENYFCDYFVSLEKSIIFAELKILKFE
jgi:hypothetical protein